jgi:hypothetical protein
MAYAQSDEILGPSAGRDSASATPQVAVSTAAVLAQEDAAAAGTSAIVSAPTLRATASLRPDPYRLHSTVDFAPSVPLGPRPHCLFNPHLVSPTPVPTPIVCGRPCDAPQRPPRRQLAVRATGGLANRVIILLSYLAVARRNNCRLLVLWETQRDCPEKFAALFQPLPLDVRVVADPALAPRGIGYTGGYPHPRFDMRELGPMALALLKPLPAIQAAIGALLQRLGDTFSAAHLRRTDLPGTSGEAGELLDAAVAAWACNDTQPLFIAADHPKSLTALRRVLPAEQIVSQGAFPFYGSVLRKTTVAGALIDLWVSSHSERFVGTDSSTFSVLVEALRVARGLPPGRRGW